MDRLINFMWVTCSLILKTIHKHQMIKGKGNQYESKMNFKLKSQKEVSLKDKNII